MEGLVRIRVVASAGLDFGSKIDSQDPPKETATKGCDLEMYPRVIYDLCFALFLRSPKSNSDELGPVAYQNPNGVIVNQSGNHGSRSRGPKENTPYL